MVYRVSESPIARIKPDRQSITGPHDVAKLVAPLVGRRQEVFCVLLLDTRHRLLRRMTVSIGTLGAALVHPRDVFREAIRRNVSAVVLVHNHPSGDPEPSRDDIELTQRLAKVGNLVGIEVIDHVVVAKDGYISLRERGGVFVDDGGTSSQAAARAREPSFSSVL